MKKRGQITIFIVLGILLLLSTLLILYMNKSTIEKTEIEEKNIIEISAVKMFIQSCLFNTAVDGIRYNGFQGGLYQVSGNLKDYGFFKTPYYFYLGNSTLPTKEVFEEELSKYIKQNFLKCTDDLNVFKEMYGVIIGDLNVSVKLTNKALIDLEWPIKILKGDEERSLDSFSQKINFDFDNIYDFLEDFEEEQLKSPNSVPLGYLSDVAHEKDFIFEIENLNNDTVKFSMLYDNYLNNEDYLYVFIAKYSWSNLNMGEN